MLSMSNTKANNPYRHLDEYHILSDGEMLFRINEDWYLHLVGDEEDYPLTFSELEEIVSIEQVQVLKKIICSKI